MCVGLGWGGGIGGVGGVGGGGESHKAGVVRNIFRKGLGFHMSGSRQVNSVMAHRLKKGVAVVIWTGKERRKEAQVCIF